MSAGSTAIVEGKYIGRSIPRKHDRKFLTGKARYINDLKFPGMLYIKFLGSPHAHARIKRIDYSRALKMKGVVMVLTGEDAKKYLDPLPVTIDFSKPPFNWHWRTVTAYPLAVDKVRFVGEPVAAVIAEDPYTAEDALGLIDVEYEPLPAVVDPEKALEKGAPLLYEEWGDNVQAHFTIKGGDVDAAFREADRIVKVEFREARHSAFPMEPRGAVSIYDPNTESLMHYDNTQAPLQARQYIARALRIPENKVRVIAVDVGGGFGSRLHWGLEVAVALASKLTGRPVKWFEDLRDNFQTQPHNLNYVWTAEYAVKNDGRVIGYRAKGIFDAGVEGTNRGSGLGVSVVAALYTAGPLKHLKGAEIEIIDVVTNKSFTCAERGYGMPQAARLYGVAMHRISQELGIPIFELWRRNVLEPEDYPYKTILGPHYDSGNFPLLLEKAEGKYAEFLRKKEELKRQGKLAGVGVAAYVEPSGASVVWSSHPGVETARIAIYPEGGVKLWTSITDIGQGTESTYAQVVADILGVKMEDVEVVEGDSDITGAGPFSSRGSVWGISAVVKTARILRERMLKIAANVLKTSVDDLRVEDGIISSKTDSSKKISVYELARQVYSWPGTQFTVPKELLEKGETTLDVQASWYSPLTAKDLEATYTAHATGVSVALVEVDPTTGIAKVVDYYVVHDAGKLVNPMVVEGQLHGGIAMGIAQALYEELIYDNDGQLLNPGRADYLMPTAVEVPNIQVEHVETPSPFTELGTKGAGEAGIISASQTVFIALEDALGAKLPGIPVRPDMIVKVLAEKGLIG
jgi:carbon-monoxide dehydrogenase large subunit